jgi:4-amino-4-deoxy-L-arabinose transferase-like glycosyltransferase
VTRAGEARAGSSTRMLRRVALWAVLAAIAASWIALLGGRALYNPDEARYAEIPREMLASGDWIVPRLDGLVYIEKPPLQYWVTALSYRLFGESEWSARLYTGLCGLATALVTAWLAFRLWDAASAWRAGILCASSLIVLVMSHQLTLDMSLTLYLTVTLAAFCVAHDPRTRPRERRLYMVLVWASAAAAFLTKGLEAGALPVLALVVYSLMHRDAGPWRRLYPLAGLAVFLALTLPWLIAIQSRLPSFFDFFIVREHFERFLTRVEARYQPWWFFGEVFVIGALPWIVPMTRALLGGWRATRPRGQFDARRLLWTYSVVVLVFFSLSDSKLIPYILPMFPPVALLVASAPESRLRADLGSTAIGLAVAGLLVVAGAAALPRLLHDPQRAAFFLSARAALGYIGAVLLAGGLLARLTARGLHGGSLSLAAVIGATAYAAFIGIMSAARSLAPLYSGGPLVAQLSPALRAVPTVYSVRMYDQGVPFYLKRTVTLVDYRGELDFGLDLQPGKALGSLAAFESRWRADSRALAVMQRVTYDTLERAGLPMVIRARTPKELIVSRDGT